MVKVWFCEALVGLGLFVIAFPYLCFEVPDHISATLAMYTTPTYLHIQIVTIRVNGPNMSIRSNTNMQTLASHFTGEIHSHILYHNWQGHYGQNRHFTHNYSHFLCHISFVTFSLSQSNCCISIVTFNSQ